MLEKIREMRVFSRERSLIHGPHITSPELDVKLLLSEILKCEVVQLRQYYANPISDKIASELSAYLERRKAGEPVSKIIGVREFWGRPFKVTRDTLDPRQDSERLIEILLSLLLPLDRSISILDLGTGTGCLLLTLVAELQNASGIGVDISDRALRVAKENATKLELESRVSFVKSNWFENISGQFDVIISNPPYICEKAIFSLSTDVKKYDPIQALNGGKDGLDAYRIIIAKMRSYLKLNGIFCLEIGYDQAEKISMLLEENAFKKFELIQDYGQQDRCIIGERTT